MARRSDDDRPVETDDRFPSGPWKGYFLQRSLPDRHWMDLDLTFRDGLLRGRGRDRVGEFLLVGRYDVSDGKCWWSKSYLGKHTVEYRGYNEGRGIWGTWEIPREAQGGFHIWPAAMGDPAGIGAESARQPAEAVGASSA